MLVSKVYPHRQAAISALLLISWLWVGVPLAWGVLETIRASMALWR